MNNPITPILKRTNVLKFMKELYQPAGKPISFYNSRFDGIITQKDLMVLPLFDKQIVRGHSIFETADVFNGKMYQLDQHLKRMESSCKLAEIPLPFDLNTIKEKVIDSASYCISAKGVKNLNIRLFVSAGGMELSIYPPKTPSVLYIVCMERDETEKNDLMTGIHEVTISDIPLKDSWMANAKTTNYMINSVCAKRAKIRGGTLGVMLDRNGYILEGPVCNFFFLNKENDLILPKWDNILKGTTAVSIASYTESQLIKTGIINKLIFKDFKAEEVYSTAKEAFQALGHYVLPVLSLDKNLISEKPGPIARDFQDFLIKDKEVNSVEVPLDRYNRKGK